MSRFEPAALIAIALAITAGLASRALAVPGPDSVAIVANANVAESVALARMYAAARHVPARQICALDLPATADVSLDVFRTQLLDALDACLTDAGVIERIEAVVLARGVPLRVQIPTETGDQSASVAATLAVWRSTVSGRSVIGEPPGVVRACGGVTPCVAAAWMSPFRGAPGTFRAGWSADVGSISWHPLLVTMLHGRSYEDAWGLVASALEAERIGGARGQFLFMDAANPERGPLDAEFDSVMDALRAAGFSDVARVPFADALTGRTLAAFFVGTQSLGATIEGNTFAPGALVDNLTSLGAVPENFEPTGEAQVSIARWVAKGVAGVHGTTDEPLNNVFPSRWLVVDYATGGTLGEAYFRRMPYAYWRNLVLGDPMAAPYAKRPIVTIGGVTEGDTLDAPRRVTVSARDEIGRAIRSISLIVDGVEVAHADADTLEHCVTPPAGDAIQILAVAQIAPDDANPSSRHEPKGWASMNVRATSGASAGDCVSADAGAGTDGGERFDAPPDEPPRTAASGCDCDVLGRRSRGASAAAGTALFALGLAWARRRARAMR